MSAVFQTNFQFPKQTKFYRGKVRDVYTIDEKYLVMVASDRISAFDVILPKPIPGNWFRKNHIKCTDAVTCHHHQIFFINRVNIAHLAAIKFCLLRKLKVGLKYSAHVFIFFEATNLME